jgi:hypothetical protein
MDTIAQTWTSIFLFLDAEKFTGKSQIAAIEIHTEQSFTLKWEYLSERKPAFIKDGEFMHHGMTKVLFEKTPQRKAAPITRIRADTALG